MKLLAVTLYEPVFISKNSNFVLGIFSSIFCWLPSIFSGTYNYRYKLLKTKCYPDGVQSYWTQ